MVIGQFKKLKNRLSNFLFRKQYPALSKYTDEYLAYLDSLFGKAANTDGFNYLCTILRVEGITSGHWDAFVEAEEAAMDLSKLLRSIGKKGQEKRALRLGLFLYCHSTEMSVPYEILANLLRCRQNKLYMMYPFADLVRVDKKKDFFGKRHLPYPRTKINHIKELATACGEEKLGEIFDSFFRNDIRNAFYHSDYAISEDEFRIIQGGKIGEQTIPLKELSEILTRCFAFYSAFFIIYNRVRQGLARGKRFHRWPNYEVLELLSDNNGLTGFKIHFPNGSYAMFERKKYKGTTSLNIICEREGIRLNVGDLDAYRKAEGWFVNGKPFEEYGTRYNSYGYWKPIIFQGDNDKILQKVANITNDRTTQGCLFYIYSTGYNAIEFVIKSNRELFKGGEYSRPLFKKKKHFVVKKCENKESSACLYDGTVYLESAKVESIQEALNEINTYMASFKKKNVELRYRLKYQLYSDVAPTEEKNGRFSIKISMDDPRNTLVASHLGLFPRTDWKIKEEWV